MKGTKPALVAAGLLVCCALMGGQAGAGPQWAWGLGVTATFIGLVVAVFRQRMALDVDQMSTLKG